MAAKQSEVASADAPASSGKGGMVQTIVFALGLFVLMILSQFLFETMACKVVPELLPNCGPVAVSEEAEEEPEELAPPIYLPLDPPLVVSFEDRQSVRFLQLTLEVMARDQEAIDAVQTHMPVIRNNLLLLMGGRTLTELTSREGKEALRQEALEELQRILTVNFGEPGVEELYFTSFMVQ